MTDSRPLDRLPRIEDFQADYTREQILSAEALNTRAIAMQAYLQAFPAFLHMRQLTEFIQGRRYFAPAECPLGGWVLMRELATPKTTTVSPNVDTLYGASYLLLDQQRPGGVERAARPRPVLLGCAASTRTSTTSPLSARAPTATPAASISLCRRVGAASRPQEFVPCCRRTDAGDLLCCSASLRAIRANTRRCMPCRTQSN